MSFILRSIRFIKRYAFKNSFYIFAYSLVFWRKRFNFKTYLLSEKELIREVKNGKSLIRFGDGEINLMLGLENHYQSFSPQLQKSMFDIVRGYTDCSPYIVSVPRFIHHTNSELRKMGKLNVWLPLKVMFGSFYYDGFFERTVGNAIAGKKVILITKKATIEIQKKNKSIPWKDLRFVVVPSEESLSSYDAIRANIDEVILSLDKKDIVLLFAMGPVGKKLIYEYSRQGMQAIDIGKVAEAMYTGESIEHLI